MTTATRPAPHALASLLVHYIAGDVPETTLDSVCDLLEQTAATADERLAFAQFCLDAVTAGVAEHALPRADEIADVIQIARA